MKFINNLLHHFSRVSPVRWVALRLTQRESQKIDLGVGFS